MFQPTEHYRYTLKEGMAGADVWSIQIAFNAAGQKLTLDGVFGPITSKGARSVQAALGITIDAIVGPETQQALCVRECSRAQAHMTPAGLLKGICFGESGGIIPTTSTKYPDGSRDYGPLQDNLKDPTEQQLLDAFNVSLQAKRVAEQVKSAHERFFGQPGATTQEAAWRLAVLNYNWEAAAFQIAAGHGETWTYDESGTDIKRHLRDAAPWVESYGVPNVKTGWDWCHFYIESKIVYVTSWTVA